MSLFEVSYDNGIIIIPDTPVDLYSIKRIEDLPSGDKSKEYARRFSKLLTDGIIEYSRKTHENVNKLSYIVWESNILPYDMLKKKLEELNVYRNLDNVLYNTLRINKNRDLLAFVGRSSAPYLLHIFGKEYRKNRNNLENIVTIVYIVTKWEKTGKSIESRPARSIPYTINEIIKKERDREISRIIVIDDVIATGYTMNTLYTLLKRYTDPNISIIAAPVILDLGMLLVSNTTNSGRNVKKSNIEKAFEHINENYSFPMDKKDARELLHDFISITKLKFGSSTKKSMIELLSIIYPGIVVNGYGRSETFPLSHFIRDSYEELPNRNIELTENEKELIDNIYLRRAKLFDEPIVTILGDIAPYIYYAPRSL